jgi:hypothetical protein
MLNDSENIIDIQSGLIKEAVYVGNDASILKEV